MKVQDKVEKIIIHCSASNDSLDIGVKEIRNWHLKRGWDDIGYHYVVRRDGRIESGRDTVYMGSHVLGHNNGSIGICWVGINDIDSRQQESLVLIVQAMMNKYDLKIEDVYGHSELYSGKTCPNLDMDWFRALLVFNV